MGGASHSARSAPPPSPPGLPKCLATLLFSITSYPPLDVNVIMDHISLPGRDATEVALQQAWYAGARKAVLRCLFDGETLLGAVTLDPDRRQFAYFVDPASLADWLGYMDLILGLDPLNDLARIGFAPSENTVLDLTPPFNYHWLKGGGMKEFSAKDVIRMTLGLPRPLENQQKLRQYFYVRGKKTLAIKRLKGDVKTLWNFYEYGRLHGFVRLRWRYLNELYAVSWNPGRQPLIEEILDAACDAEKAVDVVFGAPPSWDEPWNGCFRCNVMARNEAMFVLQRTDNGRSGPIWVGDIFAVRVIGKGLVGTPTFD